MANKDNQPYYFGKVVLMGNSAVGKTNIMMRFVDQSKFTMNHRSTIGIDFKTKTMKLGDRTIKMQLWDTAGQQKYQTISQVYYRRATSVIFVYSVMDRNSFNDVLRWIKICEQVEPLKHKIIVGNKCDCLPSERKILYDQGLNFAKRLNCSFFETSAKDNINIQQMFEALITEIPFTQKQIIPIIKKNNTKPACSC